MLNLSDHELCCSSHSSTQPSRIMAEIPHDLIGSSGLYNHPDPLLRRYVDLCDISLTLDYDWKNRMARQ